MNRTFVTMLLPISFLIVACKKTLQPCAMTAGKSAQRDESVATAASGPASCTEQLDFVVNVQKEMTAQNSRLNNLREKELTMSGDAKNKLDEKIAKLERELRDADIKLIKVRNAASDQWRELRVSLNAVLKRVDDIAKSAEGSAS